MPSVPRHASTSKRKTDGGHPKIVLVAIGDIRPAPENDQLYRPVLATDPAIVALSESIKTNRLREPIVLSRDGYIISGHRRYAACKLAGLTMIPCRHEDVRRDTEPDRFVTLLREHNRQRVKSLDEQIREAVIDADPEEAITELIDYRREKSKVDHESLSLGACRKRKRITAAKTPLLSAVRQVLDENKPYWPLTVRQIHYQLAQNLKPLKHASKPGSVYQNDKSSWRACIDICARGRLTGLLPWEAIDDETRLVIS